MDRSLVHQIWSKPSCKAQWKEEEDKTDRGRGGKTTSGNEQAWSSLSPRGQWRTEKRKRKKMDETGFEVFCDAPTFNSVPLCSVQSLDRLGRRGDMWDDSAEILFQSFLQEALVSSSSMGKYVHSLMLTTHHFLCRPWRRPPSKVPRRMALERLQWRVHIKEKVKVKWKCVLACECAHLPWFSLFCADSWQWGWMSA